MVLVGSEMVNMFELGTRVMVGMLFLELVGRIIKSKRIISLSLNPNKLCPKNHSRSFNSFNTIFVYPFCLQEC